MKFLITGCTGFIGQEACRLLSNMGHEVIGLDIRKHDSYNRQPKCRLLIADITSGHDISKSINIIGEVDYIVHLAARTDISSDPPTDYKENIQGVINILKFPVRHGFVFASTQLVNKLGTANELCIKNYSPDTSYGASKAIGETIIQNFCHKPYIILRPTTVWGPYCSQHYLNFWTNASLGLYFHSSQSAFKSFGYVTNVALDFINAALRLGPTNSGLITYSCDQPPLELVAFVNRITKATGRRLPLMVLPKSFSYIIALFFSIFDLIGFSSPYNLRRRRNILTQYIFPNSFERTDSSMYLSMRQAEDFFADWLKNFISSR